MSKPPAPAHPVPGEPSRSEASRSEASRSEASRSEASRSEASRSEPPRIGYIPALDGLRGIAVIAVVAFHLGHLSGGFLGVDLFFVLSGFLITSLLLTEGQDTNRIRLGRFWSRRARRLLPALAVLLIGTTLYARYAAAPSELDKIRWDGIATMLYVANWREIFTKVDYWSLFSAPSPLNHTWSLAIEEQFYLIWPLIFSGLLLIARRRSSPKRLATVTLITAGILGLASLGASALWLHFDTWNRIYFGTDTRAFAILAGAALAAGVVRFGSERNPRSSTVIEVAGVAGVAFLAFAWITFDEGSTALGLTGSWALRHGALAACSLAATAVIAAATQTRPGPIARVFAFTPLRWIGLISYGVYLYHWPIIVWLNADRTNLSGWRLTALRIGVTLVVATLSYFVLEQPIRHRKAWSRLSSVAIPAIVPILIAAMLITSTSGYLPLKSPWIPAGVAKPTPSPDGARIMVVGDSVADFIAKEGLVYLRADPQPDVRNLAVQGCAEPPTRSIRYDNGITNSYFAKPCDDGWEQEAAAFRPDFVVYATVGPAAGAYLRGTKWLHPCSAGFHRWIVERIADLAVSFGQHGATLVVLTTVPNAQHLYGKSSDRAEVAANACWNAALRDGAEHAPRKVELVDLAARFCTNDRSCRLHTADGAVTREDGAHYRGRSALIIGKIILERIGIDARLP